MKRLVAVLFLLLSPFAITAPVMADGEPAVTAFTAECSTSEPANVNFTISYENIPPTGYNFYIYGIEPSGDEVLITQANLADTNTWNNTAPDAASLYLALSLTVTDMDDNIVAEFTEELDCGGVLGPPPTEPFEAALCLGGVLYWYDDEDLYNSYLATGYYAPPLADGTCPPATAPDPDPTPAVITEFWGTCIDGNLNSYHVRVENMTGKYLAKYRQLADGTETIYPISHTLVLGAWISSDTMVDSTDLGIRIQVYLNEDGTGIELDRFYPTADLLAFCEPAPSPTPTSTEPSMTPTSPAPDSEPSVTPTSPAPDPEPSVTPTSPAPEPTAPEPAASPIVPEPQPTSPDKAPAEVTELPKTGANPVGSGAALLWLLPASMLAAVGVAQVVRKKD